MTSVRPSDSRDRGKRQDVTRDSTRSARCAIAAASPLARSSRSESAALRDATHNLESVPSAMTPRSPRITLIPASRSASCSTPDSSRRIAAQPRKFGSAAARPISTQAATESDSCCSSIRRTRALYR